MVDIARPSQARQKKIRRILMGAGGLVAVLLITLGLSRLKPAAPSVERSTVWIDTVKRGPMLRQVRGLGTLVPEEIRWIPAQTEGRVERLVILPGTPVKPDTRDPRAEQPRAGARGARRGVAAPRRRGRLHRAAGAPGEPAARPGGGGRAGAGRVRTRPACGPTPTRSSPRTAWSPTSTVKVSRGHGRRAGEPRPHRAEAPRHRRRGDEGPARGAGGAGRAGAGARAPAPRARSRRSRCARASTACCSSSRWRSASASPRDATWRGWRSPSKLKAVIRIAETQARDVQIGQKAAVDTRNGVVEGHVSRVDPVAQNRAR